MENWETLRRRVLLEKPPHLTVFADDVRLPNGTVVQDYLRLEMPDFVVVVPVNKAGQIGLIRSYKRGVGSIDVQPPAGMIEPGEAPAEAARRELLEETGCSASAWRSLGSYVIMGNLRGGMAHIYLAEGAETMQAPDSGDLEEQEVLWLVRDHVKALWAGGRLGQLSSASALGLALAHLETTFGATSE